MPKYFDWSENTDTYFIISDRRVLAVLIGHEKVLPIPHLLLMCKSDSDNDRDTEKVLMIQTVIATYTAIYEFDFSSYNQPVEHMHINHVGRVVIRILYNKNIISMKQTPYQIFGSLCIISSDNSIS